MATQDLPPLLRLCQLRKVRSSPLPTSAPAFETVCLPEGMARVQNRAFGGTMACQALQAAMQTLPPAPSPAERWAVYSIQGNFLGPTDSHKRATYTVETLRETRTFVTRFVVATQEFAAKKKGAAAGGRDGGGDTETRKVFSCTVDLIRRVEAAKNFPAAGPVLAFSQAPSRNYPDPAGGSVKLWVDEVEARGKTGETSADNVRRFKDFFKLAYEVLDLKFAPGSTQQQTLVGIDQDHTTSAAGVPSEQRVDADFFKSRYTIADLVRINDEVRRTPAGREVLPMDAYSLHASLLAFWLDSLLAFLPLNHHGLHARDTTANSTLDFSLRFHNDDLDVDQWHVRELRSWCADRTRHFAESRVYDRRGRLVCSESQQCISRLKENGRAPKL